jgi:hypothetical protein
MLREGVKVGLGSGMLAKLRSSRLMSSRFGSKLSATPRPSTRQLALLQKSPERRAVVEPYRSGSVPS